MPDFTDLPYRPCVGVMLVNKKGNIFTGQRIDSDLPAWQMPQGGIDDGETARDAALRELWEETGIIAEHVRIEAELDGWLTYELPDDLIPVLWGGKFRGQKQKWFLMRFLSDDLDVDITQEPREFSDWQWLEPDELVDQIVPFKRKVYAAVLDAFRDRI